MAKGRKIWLVLLAVAALNCQMNLSFASEQVPGSVPVTVRIFSDIFRLSLYHLDGGLWEGPLDMGPTTAGRTVESAEPVFATGISDFGNPWAIKVEATPLKNIAYEIPSSNYYIYSINGYWELPGKIYYLKDNPAPLTDKVTIYSSDPTGDISYNRGAHISGSPVPVYFMVNVPAETPPGLYESIVEFSMTE